MKKSALLTAMFVAAVMMATGMAGSVIAQPMQVDCDTGATLGQAVTVAQPGATIQVSGTCNEMITITTDRLTLDGGGSAVIQGAGGSPPAPGNVSEGLVNIIGAQGVEIRGFTIQGSPVDGINGRQGAAFVVRDTRVLQSGDDGIAATENSTVRFLGTCEVRGTGDSGISITHNSSTRFSGESTTTAENALAGIFVTGTSTVSFDTGSVHATQNLWGILTLGHSSLTLSTNKPTVLADDNMAAGITVGDTSDLRLFEGGMITSARNSIGLLVGGTSGLGNLGGEIVLQNNAEGLRVEDASRVAQFAGGRMTIQGNTTGIIAENGSNIRINEGASITDNGTDIVLIFASLGSFTGNTIGSITCDATSLIRGDTGVTCPTP